MGDIASLAQLDLNALTLFVLASERGSLSGAARHCGVPLATLSRQIRRLEDSLQLRLLERGRKGLALTPSGKQLLDASVPALQLLAQAQRELLQEEGVAGVLRLSVPPHFTPLRDTLTKFQQRYPQVRYQLTVTDQRIDFAQTPLDLAIRIGKAGSQTNVGKRLGSYRHILVAAPSYLSRHTVKQPKDLVNIPCATWRSDGPIHWQLGEQQLKIEPVFAANDYLHLLDIAEKGLAATELPPFMALPAIEAGKLRPLLSKHPFPKQDIRAVFPERRNISSLLRHFLDFVAEQLSQSLKDYP